MWGVVVYRAYSSAHGAKGRGIESRSLLFLLFVSKSCKKKGKSMKGSRKEESESETRERRIEEEEPAGVSGKRAS